MSPKSRIRSCPHRCCAAGARQCHQVGRAAADARPLDALCASRAGRGACLSQCSASQAPFVQPSGSDGCGVPVPTPTAAALRHPRAQRLHRDAPRGVPTGRCVQQVARQPGGLWPPACAQQWRSASASLSAAGVSFACRRVQRAGQGPDRGRGQRHGQGVHAQRGRAQELRRGAAGGAAAAAAAAAAAPPPTHTPAAAAARHQRADHGAPARSGAWRLGCAGACCSGACCRITKRRGARVAAVVRRCCPWRSSWRPSRLGLTSAGRSGTSTWRPPPPPRRPSAQLRRRAAAAGPQASSYRGQAAPAAV